MQCQQSLGHFSNIQGFPHNYLPSERYEGVGTLCVLGLAPIQFLQHISAFMPSGILSVEGEFVSPSEEFF